jgi:hypothetical protein
MNADGNFKWGGTDASQKAIGDDSNAICLNASRGCPRVSNGEAQVTILSEVASHGSCQCPKCGYGDLLIVYIYIYMLK